MILVHEGNHDVSVGSETFFSGYAIGGGTDDFVEIHDHAALLSADGGYHLEFLFQEVQLSEGKLGGPTASFVLLCLVSG